MRKIVGKVVYVNHERLVLLDDDDEEHEIELIGADQPTLDEVALLINKRVMYSITLTGFRFEELGKSIQPKFVSRLKKKPLVMPAQEYIPKRKSDGPRRM